MRKMNFAVAALAFGLTGSAHAFSLDVREANSYFKHNGQARSRIPFLDGGEPVHERLTDQVLGCGNEISICERLRAIGIRTEDIREGVRSNDFPAQYLDSQAAPWCKGRVLRITNDGDAACIRGSFLKASENKEKFKNSSWANARPFGMRGHFGNLQFLHSMAPKDQDAATTYEGIRMWMEFAYRMSLGEFDLRSDAHAVPVKNMDRHFVRGSRKVGDLLNYRFDKSRAQGIALGQMLHIAQDSFAGCHAERDMNGAITRFLSYAEQTTSRHASYDRDPDKVSAALSGPLDPVSFGTELMELRLERRDWHDVETLVKRYFGPVDGSARAVAGSNCV